MNILRRISLFMFCMLIVHNAFASCTASKLYTSCNSGYTLRLGDCVACTSIQNTSSTTTCEPTCTTSNGTCTYTPTNCGVKSCNGYFTGGGGSGNCTGCDSFTSCTASGACTINITGCDAGYYKCGSGCCVCDPNCTCAGGLAQPDCGASSCPSGQYLDGDTCKSCSSVSNTSSTTSCTTAEANELTISISNGTRTCMAGTKTCNGNYTDGPGGTGGVGTCTGCSSYGSCDTCVQSSCSCDEGYHAVSTGKTCYCVADSDPDECDTLDCTSNTTCLNAGYGSCSGGCCGEVCTYGACSSASDCSDQSGKTKSCTGGCCTYTTTNCTSGYTCSTASDCPAVSGKTKSCNSSGCCVYTNSCSDSMSCTSNNECKLFGYSTCTNGCCTGTTCSTRSCTSNSTCTKAGYSACDTTTHCCVMNSSSFCTSTVADSSQLNGNCAGAMLEPDKCYGTTNERALNANATSLTCWVGDTIEKLYDDASTRSFYGCVPSRCRADATYLDWNSCECTGCIALNENVYADADNTTLASVNNSYDSSLTNTYTSPQEYNSFNVPLATSCYVPSGSYYDEVGAFTYSEDCYYNDEDNSSGECVQSANCITSSDCGIGGYCYNGQCYCCQEGHSCSLIGKQNYLYCGSGTCGGTVSSASCTCPAGSSSGGGTSCTDGAICTSNSDCPGGRCRSTTIGSTTFKTCRC